MTTEEPTIDLPQEPAGSARVGESGFGATQLQPGDHVGHYVIRQPLGEGGFAVVYLADQLQPVQRRVALKIIKIGMDTREVIARFEAERQALAMMDHPHVAKVLDAGATDTGRPFFVMEYVPGEPITEYCDRHKLPTRQRVDLLIQACEAVQHAHQKGIIHRDIKPSNVLVAVREGEPQVKVIDFGVAKATSRHLTERTVYTEQGQLIGTPEYMSPEQVEMSALDIDTRTDIYSLGVVLYELLAGTLPFDPAQLRRVALAEIQRTIRDEEPSKPSTRLSSLGGASTEIAKRHHTDVRTLARELRGDLDWITMKAMEKDRTRRYASAFGLANDLRRHLEDQPVLAGPPGAAYRIQKFVRRHRTGVVAAVTIVLALIAGFIGTTWQAVRATRAEQQAVTLAAAEAQQRQFAEAARDEAEAARRAEAEQRDQAEREAAIARAISTFLEEMLTAPNPWTDKPLADVAREVKVVDVLDAASEGVTDRFPDEPLVEASIRTALGSTYESLGVYEKAGRHLERALMLRRTHLGPEHPETLESTDKLAWLYDNQGRYDEAEPLLVTVLEVRRRLLGDDHPDTLGAMNNLALLYGRLRRIDDAERLHAQAFKVKERVLGPEHPSTLISMANLASLYRAQERYPEAETMSADVYRLRLRVLGREHPHTLVSMDNLACVYVDQGRFDEAEPLAVEAHDLCGRVLGEAHPYTLITLHNLAELHFKQDDFAEAEPLFERAVTAARSALSKGHWHLGVYLTGHGRTLMALERLSEAEEALLEAHAVLEPALGAEHERTLTAMRALADLYDAWQKPDRAAVWRAKLPAEEAEPTGE